MPVIASITHPSKLQQAPSIPSLTKQLRALLDRSQGRLRARAGEPQYCPYNTDTKACLSKRHDVVRATSHQPISKSLHVLGRAAFQRRLDNKHRTTILRVAHQITVEGHSNSMPLLLRAMLQDALKDMMGVFVAAKRLCVSQHLIDELTTHGLLLKPTQNAATILVARHIDGTVSQLLNNEAGKCWGHHFDDLLDDVIGMWRKDRLLYMPMQLCQ